MVVNSIPTATQIITFKRLPDLIHTVWNRFKKKENRMRNGGFQIQNWALQSLSIAFSSLFPFPPCSSRIIWHRVLCSWHPAFQRTFCNIRSYWMHLPSRMYDKFSCFQPSPSHNVHLNIMKKRHMSTFLINVVAQDGLAVKAVRSRVRDPMTWMNFFNSLNPSGLNMPWGWLVL
jgi:hypothetical protein